MIKDILQVSLWNYLELFLFRGRPPFLKLVPQAKGKQGHTTFTTQGLLPQK
jgi:hypothetical protein